MKGCSLIRGVHYERFHCISNNNELLYRLCEKIPVKAAVCELNYSMEHQTSAFPGSGLILSGSISCQWSIFLHLDAFTIVDV